MHEAERDAANDSTGAAADQALRWLVRRLDAARWTAADEAALKAWLRVAPENEREFRRHEAVVARMTQPEVFDLARLRQRTKARKPSSWLKFGWAWAGVFAAAALVIFAVVVIRPKAWTQELLTKVGERREVTLPDGSTVHLNAQTRLTCRFDGNTRSVELFGGGATFQVTPDAARPFDVTAGLAAVRVVGTHFEVAFLSPNLGPAVDRSVSVAVTEGIVEVRPNSPSGRSADAVRLKAGNKAVWRAGKRAPEMKPISGAAFATWRSGRMQCEGELLADVLVELARYFPGRIELAQSSLGELRVSGTLPLDDWAEAAQLLESVLPIRVRRTGENAWRVEAAPSAAGSQISP